MNQQSEPISTARPGDISDLQPRQDIDPRLGSGHQAEDAHQGISQTLNLEAQAALGKRLWSKHCSHVFSLAMLALIFLNFSALTTVLSIYFWFDLKGTVVQSTIDAGHVIRADQTSAVFGRGMVETESSYFFLEVPMSVSKAEALTLELRGNRARYLCDSQHHCTPLVSTF